MLAQTSRQSALLGVITMAPAVLFVILGSSKWWAPGNAAYAAFERAMSDPIFFQVFNVVSPIVFLSGLALAIALNVLPMIRAPRARPGVWALVIIAAASLTMMLMLGYVAAENWLCIIGKDTRC